MALINQGKVTIYHRDYNKNNEDIYISKVMPATYFRAQAPKVLKSEINTNPVALSVYIKDSNYLSPEDFKCKNSNNSWTIEANDYIAIGNKPGIPDSKAYKVVSVAIYTDFNSKLSHIEITAE